MNKADRKNSELEGWREVKLGEIAEIITGKTPPTTKKELYGDKYPFITPTDINEASRFCKPSRYLSEQGKNRQISSILPENSICYTCIASIGKICITTEDSFTNQQINALKVYAETAEMLFIFYYLKYLTPKITSMAGGTINRIINKNLFSSIEISIPPLAEQKAIAGVLSSLDDKIDLLHRQNKTLEDMAQTLFRQWFIKQADKRWKKKHLGETVDIAIGRTPPRKEFEWFSKESGDWKWISIKDMAESGIYLFDTSEYLTQQAVDRFAIRIIPANTVILSFKMTVGRVGITAEDMLSNEAIAHFAFNHETPYSREYLYFYLKAFRFASLGSTSSIVTSINTAMIKSMMIAIPGMTLMKRFESAVKPLFNKIKSNQHSIYSLMNLRDALLPKLISGKVSVRP